MADIPEIAYHPYLAFIAQFDYAEALRIHEPASDRHDPLVKVATRFSADCGRVRDDLSGAAGAPGPARFPPYLFRPLSYSALGQTDDLAITLLDNLPLVIRMTAVNRAIENSDVAFCPRVKTFCAPADAAALTPKGKAKLARLASATDNPFWPFWDLHELIDDGERFGKGRGVDWATKASMPKGLEDLPLCVVSNFKLSTLAVLGHASLLLQAVMEAMVASVRGTCLAFLEESGEKVHAFAEPLLNALDIQSLKCVLLESQSAEDLVVLFFCSNYTVAEILITALRHLTIKDFLMSTDSPGQGAVTRQLTDILSDRRLGEVHLRLAKNDPSLENIHNNHVFMTSYTTLAVQHHALRATDPNVAGVRGFVEAHVMVRIKPGHERQIWERLAKAHESVFGKGSATHVPPPEALNKLELALRILPGLHDQIINLTPDQAIRFQRGAMVHTGDVFRFLDRFFSGWEGDPPLHGDVETGFLKIATSLVIPIPKIQKPSEVQTPLPGADAIADELPHKELMTDSTPHPVHGAQFFRRLRRAVEREQFKLPEGEEGVQFREALRRVGCPPSLQYSLVYLFQEFLACIDDPPRCVAVLDLYECFSALYNLICVECPAYLEGLAHDPVRKRREQARLFEKRLLRPFIDALQNSFTLRLQRAIPRHETRDTAFNFRGGVSKFVAAMDVPLKCSLGLYRRMFDLDPDQVNAPEFKHRFAGVTSVGVGQQTTAEFLRFGARSLPPKPTAAGDVPLSFVTFHMDVMRLYGPEQIVHFLHEFAHLYFETKISPSADHFRKHFLATPSARPGATKDASYVRMATAEIFAELVTQLFVFEADTDLFSKFYALTFSEIQEAVFKEVRGDRRPLQQRRANGLLEAVYRAFLVVDAVHLLGEARSKPVAKWPVEHPVYHTAAAPDAATWARFQDYLKATGPFYRDYRQFGLANSDPAMLARSKQHFDDLQARLGCPERLRCLWDHAMSVYHMFLRSIAADPFFSLPADFADLGRAINDSMRDGRPFRGMYWPHPERGSGAAGVDPLPIICKLAYHYIENTYGAISADKIIFREPERSRSEEAGQDYNVFLFHPGHVALYCVDPKAREQRLLNQIACFKTLWDISSQLRGRRLLDMIKLIPPTTPS